jgi:hypothetical protein
MNSPEAPDLPLAGAVRSLLKRAGAEGGNFRLVSLSGGANNQVYRVDIPGGAPLVLKRYFFSPQDPRDRFHSEKSFYDLIARADLPGRTPRAEAWDREDRLGLFSWIEGRRLAKSEVTLDAVEQALGFYLALNDPRCLAGGEGMPEASEACFDLGSHFACVERRLKRLETMERESTAGREAYAFVLRHLQPSFENYKEKHASAQKEKDSLSPDQRCLSPSDFGFHNALVQADGRIVFFDFEYAGWDDPAKFLCDFLCQPEIPIPESLAPRCLDLLCRSVPGGTTRERVSLLLPLYRLKWCCILLNEFLSREQNRRVFSRRYSPDELKARQEEQLAKARNLLEKFRDAPLI